MNLDQFKSLSDLSKTNYVLSRLQYSKLILETMYNDCHCPLSGQELEELEMIGSDFVRFGLMAEECQFDGIFDELNSKVARLLELSDKMRMKNVN